MKFSFLRFAGVIFAAVTALVAGSGLSSATPSLPNSATGDAVTSLPVAPSPQAQPSWCGWTPANNGNSPGQVHVAKVNIRTGQGTQCDVIVTVNQGHGFIARCYVDNAANERWIHVTINSKPGWVIGGAVWYTWAIPQC
ncbi:hypothetical protein KIPE111705_27635 [Kibdelosporangium persicum]|uniref:SH3 domain-containing protein n=1 Tax=Kibdelosporangium persicum TaxID=2698649 RepID=A0ABX2FHQ9_9PSEU|nr:hypothetical protein [Kibdelosporangium persicum]